MDSKHDKVIERVKKLLALATSDNQNEAEVAAKMAYDLLARHNLSLDSVKRDKEFTEASPNEGSKAMTPEELAVAEIVGTYFHVRGVFSRRVQHTYDTGHKVTVWYSSIGYVGEKHNVEIACYVHEFLLRSFKTAVKNYRKAQGQLGRGGKKAYVLGLKSGLAEKLANQRNKIKQEEGLVVMADADLDRYMEEKDLKKKRSNNDVNDRDAFLKGREDGGKMQVAAGVGSSRPTEAIGNVLKLGGAV